jgi:SAM-dependent methyltransferase
MSEVANTEQLAAWNGEEGDHWSAHEERYDAAARGYSGFLADLAAVERGEQVLDVGCGCGASTRDAARAAVGGAAVGIDLSSQMLAVARRRAVEQGLDNVSFVHGDAQVHEFPAATFDVVMSRFGVMFFADPVAAFTNLADATRPGGRVALIVWQELARNEWITAIRGALAQGRELPTPPPGAPGAFAFADPDRVRAILTDAGFADVDVAALEASFWLGADVDDAYEFIGEVGVVRGLLEDLSPAAEDAAREELRATLAAHAGPDGVRFGSRGWGVRAVR